MERGLGLVLYIGISLATLVGAYLIGSLLERRHFIDIRRRERGLDGFMVTTFESLPESWQVADCQLVAANVVVSLDYFKRFIAGLRGLVGGRITTYEPLLDRARREAILRVVEDAKARGFDGVVNLRLETSRLANSEAGEGVAGIEVLAFGTALLRSAR